MHPTLVALVDLQRAESELKRLQSALDAVPHRRAEAEAALAAERGRLDAVKEELAGSQKTRRQDEGGLKDLEAKRSKYKGQLTDVKTNREYTAMLHEIEGVEREISAVEDRILAEMEKADTLARSVKFEEGRFAEASTGHQKAMKAIAAEEQTLSADLARAKAVRDEVAARLPADRLAMFQRIAKLRGTAVCEARDAVCQLCHTKLRGQMFVDLKRGEQLFQCPACNRVLYYEPPVPEVSPGP